MFECISEVLLLSSSVCVSGEKHISNRCGTLLDAMSRFDCTQFFANNGALSQDGQQP